MPSRQAISRLVCALSGLALAGCYSPYRHAPYSPYGSGVPMYNPQAVPLQPQFGPPAGSPTPVYPDNSFPPAGGTFAPNGSGGSQFNNGSQLSPTPDPGGGGTFPPSNSGGFGPTPSNGFNPNLPPANDRGLVPDYGDPENLPPTRGGGGTFEGGNSTPFGPDGASFERDHSSQSISRTQYERGQGTRELQLTAHQTSPVEPFPRGTAAAQEPHFTKDEPFTADKPNPYGYDAIGYRWLRGVVDFDEQQNVWVLIYNPNPGPQDVYKGQITLIDNGQLGKLQNNAVVLVEGQVDTTFQQEASSRPRYHVQTLHGPLVPKF